MKSLLQGTRNRESLSSKSNNIRTTRFDWTRIKRSKDLEFKGKEENKNKNKNQYQKVKKKKNK